MKRFFVVALLFALVVFGGLYFFRFHTAKAIFPVRGEYIELDGEKIYTIVRGKGRTVLFLHGFPYHSETFARVVSTPLEGYRFITLDFPGAGLSSKNTSEIQTPKTLAIMLKLFLDRIGVDKVDLVGHDLGGGVAIVFAALFPHMVDRVMLIAPDSSAGTSAHIMTDLWRLPILGELWATLRLDRQFIRGFLKKSWLSTDDAWHQIVERYARILNTPNGRSGFLSLHRGRVDFDYTNFEEQFDATALILWGTQDRVLAPTTGTRLLQSLAQSKVELLDGVGHLPQEEIPGKISQRLKLFLEKEIVPKKRFEEVMIPAEMRFEEETKPKRPKRRKKPLVKSIKKKSSEKLNPAPSTPEDKSTTDTVETGVGDPVKGEATPPEISNQNLSEGIATETDQPLATSDETIEPGNGTVVENVTPSETVSPDDPEKKEIQ